VCVALWTKNGSWKNFYLTERNQSVADSVAMTKAAPSAHDRGYGSMKKPREELLEAIRELGVLFPEWRFGQLVANVATAARGPQTEAIWDALDAELLAAARRLIERNRDRAPVSAG